VIEKKKMTIKEGYGKKNGIRHERRGFTEKDEFHRKIDIRQEETALAEMLNMTGGE
jgi:hypothetical protein